MGGLTHTAALAAGIMLALSNVVALAAKDGSAHGADGFPATPFEYARMVEPELGVPPRINLGAQTRQGGKGQGAR